MKPEGSLPRLQEPATCPYPKPDRRVSSDATITLYTYNEWAEEVRIRKGLNLEIVSSPLCVRVRSLGSVGSQTQLSLRCNYVLQNNYMFRPMMTIVRLPWEYLRAYCKVYRAHNIEISTYLVNKV